MKTPTVVLAALMCLGAGAEVVSSSSFGPFTLDTRLDKSVELDGVLAPKVGGALELASAAEGSWFVYAPGETPETEYASGSRLVIDETMFEKFVFFRGVDADGKAAVSKPVLVSRLPVMYIDVDGGETVMSKTIDYGANMRLQGNAEWSNEKQLYNGRLTMHVRGNSTADTAKKPYKLKLDSKADLLGMGKNKHWVLLSNPYDFSLLRNKVFYDLSAEMGLVAMDSTWVDVVVNGEFMGNYQLCEHIRVGDTRIDVFDWEGEAETVAKAVYAVEKDNGMTKDRRDEMNDWLEQNLGWITDGGFTYNDVRYSLADYAVDTNAWDTTRGYIFELDNFYDEVSEYYTGAGKLNMPVMVNRPEYLVSNPALFNYTKSVWSNFWEACVSPDGYNRAGKHYSELSSIDDMAAYWLVMVLAANAEANGWSRFAYMKDSGFINWGPVWDFDNSCGGRSIEAVFTEDAQGNPVSVLRNEWYSSGWNVGVDQGYGGSAPATCFYPEWSDDPYFCLKLYEKFKSIAGYLDRLIADDGLIEEYIGYLRESGDANAETWAGKVYDTTRGFYVSKHIAFSGEFSEPEWMRTVLKSRIEWMRARMTSLADTISSLRCSSTNPYVDGSSAFEFDFGSAPSRLYSKEPTPDVVILAGDDLGFSLSLSGAAADAELVAVYANGIFVGSHPVAEGRVSLDIGALPLTNRDGERNLILFAAKAQDGSTLATSYALVTMAEDENEFLRYADCATVVSGDASAVALDTRAVPADGVRVPRSLDEVLPFALCGDSDWRLGGNAGFVLSAIVEHRGGNVGKILKSGSGEMVYENRRFPKSVVEYRLSHGNTEEETAIFDFSAIGDCTSADFLFPGLSLTIR